MSLVTDIEELRARFISEWDDVATLTLFANATDVNPVKDGPYVRYTVLPGSREIVYGGPVYSQLGRVTLQVFVPKARGTTDGYALAEAFTEIFRDWRSEDGCLRCLGHEITSLPGDDTHPVMINVSVRWESLRHP